jgi:hypothetical protein
VRALRPDIEREEPVWAEAVRRGWELYRDVVWVSLETRVPLQAVIAILENLKERGELPVEAERAKSDPRHPSLPRVRKARYTKLSFTDLGAWRAAVAGSGAHPCEAWRADAPDRRSPSTSGAPCPGTCSRPCRRGVGHVATDPLPTSERAKRCAMRLCGSSNASDHRPTPSDATILSWVIIILPYSPEGQRDNDLTDGVGRAQSKK